MARTRHHGARAKEKLYPYAFLSFTNFSNRPHVPTPPKRRRTSVELHWMSTPGQWTREMMTRPQRARVRNLTSKVMLDPEIAEYGFFPHPKKPHIYYW